MVRAANCKIKLLSLQISQLYMLLRKVQCLSWTTLVAVHTSDRLDVFAGLVLYSTFSTADVILENAFRDWDLGFPSQRPVTT